MRREMVPKKQGLYDPRFEHDSCGVGFVCNIKGKRSNSIVKQALEVLKNLSHRGAVGADPKTGDGAGILIQIPHEFFIKVASQEEFKLPPLGEYGTGIVFLPVDAKERKFCKNIFERVVKEEGLSLLGWRKVPVDDKEIGLTARESQPCIEQIFIAKGKGVKKGMDFERRLYVVRKVLESKIRDSRLKEKGRFYITNISSRTFSYKGLLQPHQVEKFFLDLQEKNIKSAIGLVHYRYITNTFPTWDLAQPFRLTAHNGEINTLRGNLNWMKAREALLRSDLFGKD
ncbi:MAG: glutamate synthase subunit alpha, partial [Candidatus Omnitrophota bacterium]|nr:glutamate synthase subunit alpha [Candidatus Omnitrophota bacterium]